MKEIPQNVSESTKRLNPHLYAYTARALTGINPLGEEMTVITKATKKRIRQSSKPLMNKLESEWHEELKRKFNLHLIQPQSIRFMLANGVWYKPDFIVWTPMPLAFEVKGPFAHRGGFENLKIAAHKYPNILWTLVWKQNGTWMSQPVLP